MTALPVASDENRLVAQMIAGAFGNKPSVLRYWDNLHEHFVDVASVVDSPFDGITSYGTIGLSDWPLPQQDVNESLRVEMLGACRSRVKDFVNILATAAFCVINSRWGCFPGAIFDDVVSMHYSESSLSHMMFVSPFLWEDKLETLRLHDKTVAWLLGVPISDAERSYAEVNGATALENAFQQNDIDIFNIDRPSVL